jgi:hypothetical protein
VTDEHFENETHISTDEEMQALDPQSLPAGLGTARDLLGPDADEDMGDFEPGGRYKGFEIVPAPSDAPVAHLHWPARFYVSSRSGLVGLVPWPGSQVVWAWERGWTVDLHRPQVESLLKEEKGKKK